jgi:glycosyltransferase involved in cell wall biosynthesis
MNVVILSDHASEGGAAVATRRIVRSLRHFQAASSQCSNATQPCAAENSRLSLHHYALLPTANRSTSALSLWYEESEWKRQICRPLRKLLPRWFPHPNTPDFAAKRLRCVLRKLRPDVINVHNLHAAAPWGWGPHLVGVCLEFAPVVWTLHDMWSFTGRCAYSYDCEKYMTGCDASCPTHHEAPKLELGRIRNAWEERRSIYSRHCIDLVVVTPSRWLAEKARRGLFARHRIEVIPYGVPDGLYWSDCRASGERVPCPRHPGEASPTGGPTAWACHPSNHSPLTSHHSRLMPRERARRELGIPTAGPVLLLAAFDLTERRKGAEILPYLWRAIEHRPLTIATMGHGTVVIDEPLIEVHSLSWIDNERRKAVAYCAADALLHSAPVDNFPNVVLEALACGTPTIAMPVGGLPEMVRPGVSGWLADEATPMGLGQAVDRAVRDMALGKSLRESSRDLARQEYSLELQGQRYYQLFQELRLARKHATMLEAQGSHGPCGNGRVP